MIALPVVCIAPSIIKASWLGWYVQVITRWISPCCMIQVCNIFSCRILLGVLWSVANSISNNQPTPIPTSCRVSCHFSYSPIFKCISNRCFKVFLLPLLTITCDVSATRNSTFFHDHCVLKTYHKVSGWMSYGFLPYHSLHILWFMFSIRQLSYPLFNAFLKLYNGASLRFTPRTQFSI